MTDCCFTGLSTQQLHVLIQCNTLLPEGTEHPSAATDACTDTMSQTSARREQTPWIEHASKLSLSNCAITSGDAYLHACCQHDLDGGKGAEEGRLPP